MPIPSNWQKRERGCFCLNASAAAFQKKNNACDRSSSRLEQSVMGDKRLTSVANLLARWLLKVYNAIFPLHKLIKYQHPNKP